MTTIPSVSRQTASFKPSASASAPECYPLRSVQGTAPEPIISPQGGEGNESRDMVDERRSRDQGVHTSLGEALKPRHLGGFLRHPDFAGLRKPPANPRPGDLREENPLRIQNLELAVFEPRVREVSGGDRSAAALLDVCTIRCIGSAQALALRHRKPGAGTRCTPQPSPTRLRDTTSPRPGALVCSWFQAMEVPPGTICCPEGTHRVPAPPPSPG